MSAVIVKARPVCTWKPELGFYCVYWLKKGQIGSRLQDANGEDKVFETVGAAEGAHLEVMEMIA